ncbi:MAG: TatD family hydrolase [Verrucomicrobium sp.]|nr:TatD family hydrolase [Verrucomicrobium sp.]
MLTDSHAHLASKQFTSDLPEIIDRARAAGVERIVCISTTLEDARRVLQIADTYPEVDATVGIHPCDADTVQDQDASFITELREFASHPKVVGIGEVGLDYYHQPPEGFTLDSWKSHQAFVLERQLELAAELKLNVVLHNRESFDDLVAQVLPWSDRLRGVFHCFTGGPEQALPLIQRGHLVSFTGIVTFKNGQIIQDCARAVPLNGFMLETDCPYLAPMPYRGKRNEPAYVANTADFVASLRGISKADLTQATGKTAQTFFRRL